MPSSRNTFLGILLLGILCKSWVASSRNTNLGGAGGYALYVNLKFPPFVNQNSFKQDLGGGLYFEPGINISTILDVCGLE